jgi:hypothetical protein
MYKILIDEGWMFWKPKVYIGNAKIPRESEGILIKSCEPRVINYIIQNRLENFKGMFDFKYIYWDNVSKEDKECIEKYHTWSA